MSFVKHAPSRPACYQTWCSLMLCVLQLLPFLPCQLFLQRGNVFCSCKGKLCCWLWFAAWFPLPVVQPRALLSQQEQMFYLCAVNVLVFFLQKNMYFCMQFAFCFKLGVFTSCFLKLTHANQVSQLLCKQARLLWFL